jgi:guanylate kinase
VSATTRSARSGEVDGADYLFVSEDAFDEMRANGAILEWAEYGGNLYGTPTGEVLPVIATGHDVILDIENEGAKQIRASYPQALMIFISPPSLVELASRLAGRGDTSDGDMSRRLGIAESQMREAPGLYDHIVVNDDLAGAITQILDILNKPPTAP